MKKPTSGGTFQQAAFTLIELLVVIAVIALLASMLMVVGNVVGRGKIISTATAELKEVETSIEAYKSKMGFYPPDRATNCYSNPLYFELVGSVFTNDTTRTNGGWGYATLDNNSWIPTNDVYLAFQLSGFANSATSIRGDDDRSGPINFLKDFRNMEHKVGTSGQGKVLLCSIGWDDPRSSGLLCTWRYNSSHPTNNVNSYDLWVDLYVNNKTNRICNWSTKPLIVAY